MTPEIKSYEAHVTIEPVFGSRFAEFERICCLHKFRPAELLLMKNRQETPLRSNKDSFCTGHGKDYEATVTRTEMLVADLKQAGFKVWRYKVEGMLVDVRFERLISLSLPVAA